VNGRRTERRQRGAKIPGVCRGSAPSDAGEHQGLTTTCGPLDPLFAKLPATMTFAERPLPFDGTVVLLTNSGLPARHPVFPPSPQYGLAFGASCCACGPVGTPFAQV